MPLSPEICERLVLLTLALEEALQNEDWTGANSLLDARSQILDGLEASRQNVPDATVKKVQSIEARILLHMGRRTSSMAGEMRGQVAATSAFAGRMATSEAQFLDRRS